MNLQKILIPLAIIGGSALAYRSYGWAGIAAVVTFLVFGILLHFTRLMTILKRAANRPIGHVDSAVMLNAKLKPGATLMHVVAMTRSLGLLKSIKDAQPEVFEWKDGTDSTVTCTFVSGKLASHVLARPAQPAEVAA
ncbi:MAG: glycerate kinase [Polaromonas sp.]